MERYDLKHPEYDAWLIGHNVRSERTSQLLHALTSFDVRMEMHYRWRAERCNPAIAYRDDIDRAMIVEIVNRLEERIDR